MLGICLLAAGIALFLNGINYFAKFNSKVLGAVNLLSGGILFLMATITAINAADIVGFANSGTTYVFAINFIILGLHFLLAKNFDFRIFGWFSLLGAIISVVFAVQAITIALWELVILWFMWAILWFLSFLDSALNIKWAGKIAPYNLIINAVFSMLVPAVLILLGIIL